jgi:hypothetical protein
MYKSIRNFIRTESYLTFGILHFSFPDILIFNFSAFIFGIRTFRGKRKIGQQLKYVKVAITLNIMF